jgi:DNA-nicking Smr family endonuclease
MKRRRGTPRFDATDPLLDAKPVAELDLHGHTAVEVPALVTGFLTSWSRRAPGRVVRIITGKGRGSAGKPVLRGKVAALLRGALRHLVADWSSDSDDAGFVVRIR